MSNIQPEALKTIKSQNLGQINKGKKRTHVFNTDFTDYNPSFFGKFMVHQPTQLEKLEIGKTKAILLGGVPPIDAETDNISHILATLDVVIDQKPEWFDVDDPDVDYDILFSVYEEYIKWVNSFRNKPRRDTNIGDSQDTRSEVPVVGDEGVESPTN